MGKTLVPQGVGGLEGQAGGPRRKVAWSVSGADSVSEVGG